MKATFNKFMKTMTAAAFAEAGEWNTAIEMLPASEPRGIISWLDRQMMAITFAESGLYDEAVSVSETELSTQKTAKSKKHDIRKAYGYYHAEV